MSIISILQSKKRGMTTIIATLLFVSMVFTALIPLQLSMLQTDAYESSLIQEIETFDAEKDQENMNMVAYPTSTDSSYLRVRVQNTGIVDIKIVKLWIKDESYILNDTISYGEVKVLGPFNISNLEKGASYPTKVISERGNSFSSSAGNMIFSSQGVWFTPSLGINVYISNDKGKYYIRVSNETWSSDPYYETLGIDFGDLVVLFEVDAIDTYHVVCKKNGPTGPDLPGTPIDVDINWPNGSPIVFVFTSGLDT